MIAHIAEKGGKVVGNMREIIRSNLERYLSESGYTQKEFAEKLGVSKSSVTNWVKGKNSPDVDLVVPICKLLNITIKDFYSDSSPANLEPQEDVSNIKKAPLYSSEAEEQLIALHRKLNSEGQEKLLDYADDLVASGKYISRNQQLSNRL